MEFDTVYTGVCSWCYEIVVGIKNSSLISWQVMFFKREKSTMENFYAPTINVLERKFLPIHTNHCVHFKYFLHLIMICFGKVLSKSNMIKSCSWDYDPEALLFNTLWEKYLGHKVAPPLFSFFSSFHMLDIKSQ